MVFEAMTPEDQSMSMIPFAAVGAWARTLCREVQWRHSVGRDLRWRGMCVLDLGSEWWIQGQEVDRCDSGSVAEVDLWWW